MHIYHYFIHRHILLLQLTFIYHTTIEIIKTKLSGFLKIKTENESLNLITLCNIKHNVMFYLQMYFEEP